MRRTAETPKQLRLLIATVLILGAITCVNGVKIKVNKRIITPTITPDIQILCDVDDSNDTDETLSSIGLYARRNSSGISLIAEIQSSHPHAPSAYDDDVTVYGQITRKRSSFILVVWRQATFTTSGTYYCETKKYDNSISRHRQAPKIERSNRVAIKNRMSKFCSHFHDYFYYNRTKNAISLFKRLRMVIGNKTEYLEEKIDDLFLRLDSRLNKLFDNQEVRENHNTTTINIKDMSNDSGSSSSSRRQRRVLANRWPVGKYALLKTDEGCPSAKGFTWEKGFFKHHTESSVLSKNQDRVSLTNNFATPLISKVAGNNFIFTQYCSKRTISPGPGPQWPKGSYCVNRVGHCPDNFSSGYLTIDNEDDQEQGSTHNGPDGTASRIFYCCRKDGDPHEPIFLPKTHSFFLYRYGGSCQLVHGMNVNAQWIEFDTEDKGNVDRYQNEFHPDGYARSGIKIIACHYRPSRYKK